MIFVSTVVFPIIRNAFSSLRTNTRLPVTVFSAGDHRLRTIGRQIESLVTRQCEVCVTPATPLREAVGALSKTGGRLYLTEGLWNFNKTLEIDSKFIQIHSLSPGRTVFRRESAMASTDPIISSTGVNNIFEGIRFIDETDTVATHALKISGSNSIVRNCVFEDFHGGVLVSTANRVRIMDCEFHTGVNRAIEYSGTCVGGMITANSIERTGGNVYLGDDVSLMTVIGNTFDTSGVQISYFAGQNIETGSALNVIDPSRVEERC
jgi:hypothetical protein